LTYLFSHDPALPGREVFVMPLTYTPLTSPAGAGLTIVPVVPWEGAPLAHLARRYVKGMTKCRDPM